MGLVRLFLALSVVAAHTGFVFGVNSEIAVEAFFIISGYLMSLILTERQSYSSNMTFWKSRALRIYPLYWLVATLSFVFAVFRNSLGGTVALFDVFKAIPDAGKALLTFSNTTIFLQDVTLFASADSSHIFLVSNFRDHPIQLHDGLLVPQAWSLSLELTFYLLAPFVLRKKIALIGLFSVSIFLKAALLSTGIGFVDPWSYRFFPAELTFFLAGALSHQYLKPLATKLNPTNTKFVGQAVRFMVPVYILTFPLIPGSALRSLLLVGLLLVTLPSLATTQAHSKIDSKFGEMSYPVYVWHLLVLEVFAFVLGDHFSTMPKYLVFAITTIATLAISVFTNRYFDKPIQTMRIALRKRGT